MPPPLVEAEEDGRQGGVGGELVAETEGPPYAIAAAVARAQRAERAVPDGDALVDVDHVHLGAP